MAIIEWCWTLWHIWLFALQAKYILPTFLIRYLILSYQEIQLCTDIPRLVNLYEGTLANACVLNIRVERNNDVWPKVWRENINIIIDYYHLHYRQKCGKNIYSYNYIRSSYFLIIAILIIAKPKILCHKARQKPLLSMSGWKGD